MVTDILRGVNVAIYTSSGSVVPSLQPQAHQFAPPCFLHPHRYTLSKGHVSRPLRPPPHEAPAPGPVPPQGTSHGSGILPHGAPAPGPVPQAPHPVGHQPRTPRGPSPGPSTPTGHQPRQGFTPWGHICGDPSSQDPSLVDLQQCSFFQTPSPG